MHHKIISNAKWKGVESDLRQANDLMYSTLSLNDIHKQTLAQQPNTYCIVKQIYNCNKI